MAQKIVHTTESTNTAVRIVPANEVSGAELDLVFGSKGTAWDCQCQWFQNPGKSFDALSVQERIQALHAQTQCGIPAAKTTSGLIAFLGDEPVGWCAVEPRTAYPRLRSSRIVFGSREEDKDDESVWAAVCFVTRAGYRRRGISRALASAAVEFARSGGAQALEGYPLQLAAGQAPMWGELYVGSRSIFAEAGFTEVAHPTPRRFVMRIDFGQYSVLVNR
ncbi:GNAT family N-acetyltransferase [Arthrobacter sp. MYb227]|uniref:GNAT family N-acetyltransferase n=1 Tax=Arthrobacter sp. MYb227 TaxID=1848601 RepID=UPI000CFB9E0A|nr:GNAT family N-acetyltransferase [Arthrobacter sp. MYb227]PQZ94877.1 GNAT family N-acetyltransferase [Arthrobacter sp. MYb227]